MVDIIKRIFLPLWYEIKHFEHWKLLIFTIIYLFSSVYTYKFLKERHKPSYTWDDVFITFTPVINTFATVIILHYEIFMDETIPNKIW